MSRLIDANEVLKSCVDEKGNYLGHDAAVVGEAVSAAPTVNAVAVVHGEWRRIKETGFFKAECSACGKTEYCTSKYCPNCGAKMSNGERKGRDE